MFIYDLFAPFNRTAPIRRNAPLPIRLNYEVNAAGINVPRVLQDALMEKLNIERPLR